jgi:hypothetical protein
MLSQTQATTTETGYGDNTIPLSCKTLDSLLWYREQHTWR